MSSGAWLPASLSKRKDAILRAFPERQIYVRSAGQIQFFTLSPRGQAILAAAGLVFLLWAALATSLVVFQDRSAAARDRNYAVARAAYQDRLADLRQRLRDLSAGLRNAEKGFAAASHVAAREQALTMGLLAREYREENSAGAPVLELPAAFGHYEDGGVAVYAVSKKAYLPSVPVSREGASGFSFHAPPLLERLPAIITAAAAGLFTRTHRHESRPNPQLAGLARQTGRMALLARREAEMLARAQSLFSIRMQALQAQIRRAGISPDRLMGGNAAPGMGGPEIPLDGIRIAGLPGGDFTAAYLRADAVLNRLATVLAAVRHLPAGVPAGARFEFASGFGPRIDPFTGRYEFHPGIDFAAPWGTPVLATAPGVVVFAGVQGSYGNLVEIDHGLGFRTRYAHLSSLAVKAGAAVAKGALIGKIGSTGRSTGPHVHYEVWYANQVRDPALFMAPDRHGGAASIRAGNVFAASRSQD